MLQAHPATANTSCGCYRKVFPPCASFQRPSTSTNAAIHGAAHVCVYHHTRYRGVVPQPSANMNAKTALRAHTFDYVCNTSPIPAHTTPPHTKSGTMCALAALDMHWFLTTATINQNRSDKKESTYEQGRARCNNTQHVTCACTGVYKVHMLDMRVWLCNSSLSHAAAHTVSQAPASK